MPRRFNDLDALEPGQKAFGAQKFGLVNNQVSMRQKDAGPTEESELRRFPGRAANWAKHKWRGSRLQKMVSGR